MPTRLHQGIVLLAALVLAGCGTSGLSSAPSAPSSPAPPRTIPQAASAVYAPNVTLSGLVTEMIQDVQVPIEGVWVYCEPCGRELTHLHRPTATEPRGSPEYCVTHFRST